MRKVTIALIPLLVLMTACSLWGSAQPTAEPAVEQGARSDVSVAPEEEAAAEEPAAEEPAAEEAMMVGEAEMPAPAEDFAGVAAPPAALPTGTPMSAQPGTPEAIAPPGTEGTPDAMFFEDYGTNPFTETAVDNLSTFAVDVDTGSYTLARSYLNDGILPPPEAIRLEEFVNYFDQEYPLPQEDAFGITMEAAPTPFNSQDSYVMRVGIQGYDVPPELRPDAVLIFVIDVSGSMDQGNRLGAVKGALNALVANLRPADMVGIVVYGSSGRVLLNPTPVSQADAILAAINQLVPDGSTNAEEGLTLAYQMATAAYEPGKINRLILCSDGVANVGVTGPEPMLEVVRAQAREGITLTTVGFGMGNYNDVLMEQLADDGDGQYFYVDTPSEAERIFVDRLTGTLLTIALDAKIQVEFNPETVALYRLMGYENRDVADEDFRDDTVDAGEVGSGHSVTALYEIVPTALPQGVVATVRLRWEDPETHEVTEIERSISAEEVHPSFDDASPRFRLDAAVAAFADVLGEGIWSQMVEPEDLLLVARQIAGELPDDADVWELVDLIERAIELGR